MENLFSQIDMNRFQVAPTNKTEYNQLIQWVADTAFKGIPPKRRFIAVHKKLENVPVIEIKRWQHIAMKDPNPGLRFNIEYKKWRIAEERAANE